MSALHRELEDAEARVERLKLQISQGTCAEVGHDWRHLGGRNAGCDDACQCSIPVYQCAKCADCDYGENEEAADTMKRCTDLCQDNGLSDGTHDGASPKNTAPSPHD